MITKLDINQIKSTNDRLDDIDLLESAYHVDSDDDYMKLIFNFNNDIYRWQSGLKLSEFNPFDTNLAEHYIIYFLKSKVVYMIPTEVSSDDLVYTKGRSYINLGSFVSSLISRCQVNSILPNIAVDYPMSKPKDTISYIKPVYKDQAYGQGLQT